MLVLLPVVALGSCIALVKTREPCWREATLGGAVIWGVLLVGSTELLSALHGLSSGALALAWALVALALIGQLLRDRRQRPLVAWPRPRLDRLQAALLAPLAVLLLVLALVAGLSAPTTWDAMTYHLARLIHWQQAASLAPYPTHILRQLYLQPGAEYVLLHLQLLSGGDHLAGLVQWAGMLGALLGTAVLAEALGAGRVGRCCAVIVAASIPIGMLEATSTQNDYVVSFWLVCVMVWALRLAGPNASRVRWPEVLAFGASLGLALLTKATAYLVALPIVVWLSLRLLRRLGRRSWPLLIAAGAVALAINVPFFARNMLVFGSPVGPPDEGSPALRYLNDTLSPALYVSNVVRDLGVNLVATPSPSVNVRSQAVVLAVHQWLGVDLVDPRTTWGQERFREQPAGLAFDENFASNPLHLALVVLALAALWPLRRRLPPLLGQYAVLLVAGFALFAAVLRWQPWDTRLELPFFVLAAPLVAVVAERLSPRLSLALAGLLLVSMLPWVVYNQERPLVGPRSIVLVDRTSQYFASWPALRPGYLGALDVLRQQGCASIGYMSGADSWEYPLWALAGGPIQVQQVQVSNVSAAFGDAAARAFRPCAILALGSAASTPSVDVAGQTYRISWDSGGGLERVALLTPVPGG